MSTLENVKKSPIAKLRKEYKLHELWERDVDANPFNQFNKWFDEALAATLIEQNAMALATATKEGQPSVRFVLLKGFDERGFVFYTNYQGRKGQELTQNPRAALAFHWGELERQVRIEGRVEQVSPQESDDYFQSRPWGSRLSAWASQQSQVITNRAVLEQRLQALTSEYANQDIPRPPYWGGYRLIPTSFEFWQGRTNRLHDRLRYRQSSEGSWLIERLSP